MVPDLCTSKLGRVDTILTPLHSLCEDKQLMPSELISHHWWEERSTDIGLGDTRVCFCSVWLLDPSHEIQPHPPRCPSSLRKATQQEMQSAEQAAAWRNSWALGEEVRDPKSPLEPAGKHFCCGEAAPSLGDGKVEAAGPGECCARGQVCSSSCSNQQRQPRFTSSSKVFPEWMQWDQVLYPPEEEILTITGNFVLSGLPAPKLFQMAQQRLSTATSSS